VIVTDEHFFYQVGVNPFAQIAQPQFDGVNGRSGNDFSKQTLRGSSSIRFPFVL